MESISFLAAFTAGIISFISPCVLPLVPAYISFISGVSLEEMREKRAKAQVLKRVSLHSLLFIIGFSVIFVALGASATTIGKFLLSKFNLLMKLAGVLIILFGLHTAGVFKLKFLNYERRFQTRGKPFGPIGAFIVGLTFAFGWTPCIGPILAGILAYASTQETVTQGVLLLSVYSLGLGIPFFLAGLSVNTFFTLFNRIKRHFKTIEIVSGAFLVLVGILIFTGSFTVLSSQLVKWFPWLNLG